MVYVYLFSDLRVYLQGTMWFSRSMGNHSLKMAKCIVHVHTYYTCTFTGLRISCYLMDLVVNQIYREHGNSIHW